MTQPVHSESEVPKGQLSVRDFGPIIQADVHLSPLTVFIGPNNTGKSYLAILIYALYQYFGGQYFAGHGILHDIIRGIRGEQEYWIPNSQETIADLTHFFKKQEGALSGEASLIQLPESVTKTLRSVFTNVSVDGLTEEITRCFGQDIEALQRASGSGRPSIRIRSQGGREEQRMDHQLQLGGGQDTIATRIPQHLSLEIPSRRLVDRFLTRLERLGKDDLDDRDNRDERLFHRRLYEVLFNIGGLLIQSVYAPFTCIPFYLPADRTGIMHAHKTVVGSVMRDASRVAIRKSRQIPSLQGIIADFLENLIELDDRRSWPTLRAGVHDPLHGITEVIEKNILQGSVLHEYTEPIGYPSFYYQPEGLDNKLPLLGASSMVSELAPVVLYLRHIVDPGDVLIIEEPESHLHPKIQVEFTRQLAALVNAGVRIIMTTHSEWVLDELANRVNLSRLHDQQRRGISANEIALTPDQIGVWLFEPDQSVGGTTVKEINIDESGLYPSEYDTVTSALHNDWARIGNRLGQ